MIEKLRELVETALDWFPEVKLEGVYGCRDAETGEGYYIIAMSQPRGRFAGLALNWSECFVRERDDLALVMEVRYQLMKERQ